MIYKSVLERMLEAQPEYQASPYQRLNEAREKILANYYDKQKAEEPTNINFTINGKKVK